MFTVGNLITLIISLAAIFVIRYMDRQNRSVDLAREYGKRLKDDIAAFAEEKAAEVKDNGLVLDVQKSAVKEGLNRLTEANAELSDKTGKITQKLEEIGRIGERINAYDKSMEELIRATKSAYENIDRLKQESAFVETTAKKIDGIKSDTAELEKALNSLELRFERENAAILEKAVNTLVVQAEGKVEDLRGEAEAIERQVEEHRAAVDRVESERTVKLEKDISLINKVLGEALDKAKSSAVTLEGEALNKYREEAMQRAHQFQETIEEKLAEYRADQSAQWKRFESLSEDAINLDSQLRQTMEAAEVKLRSDLALFEESQKQEQARVSSAFIDETENLKRQMAAVEEDFNKLKQPTLDTMSKQLKLLEDDFFADLVERRTEIDNRLNELHSKLEKGFISLGEEAETERRNFEQSFKEDMKARIEEQGNRILSDLERFKIRAETFEDKIQNIMDGTENRISGLNTSTEEIRRGIKEFNAQTGLFEKTEDLKISLERSMDTLKTKLSGMEEKQAEAERLETEFIKIRRLEDEVNAKMTRFLSEKNHLDSMEKDFERLLQTSARVEEKLKEVNFADDTLQNIQVSLRKLEDAVVSVEEKYQRVENKKQLLEETDTGIRNNLQMLEETELAVRKCRENIDRTEDELDSMRPTIDRLALASEKAAEAQEKLNSLDRILSTIESRIDKMQTAREWLARTETRFEELNREAQGELKMLEAVLKDKTKKSGGSKGAPPLSTRDNIIRLSRQGWKPEEIARSMNISPGEVELIIEMGASSLK